MTDVMSYDVGLNRLEQLREYYQIEGTELGEFCELLDRMWGYSYCAQTDDFRNALANEILAQLDHFQQNTEIVEEVITKQVVRKDLEWKN